jgi:hypothetical protein
VLVPKAGSGTAARTGHPSLEGEPAEGTIGIAATEGAQA